MDHASFDRIARLLGSATTRRTGLRALVGAFGLAALAPDAEADAADRNHATRRGAAPKKHPNPQGPCGNGSGPENACTKDAQCCTGYCARDAGSKNGRCRCLRAGEPCTKKQTCCDDSPCTNGICPRRKTCANLGGACTGNPSCCGTLVCRNGTCKNPCTASGGACATDANCCSGLACRNGTCRNACAATGGSCATDADCCAGNECQSGICRACAAANGTCSVNGDCCAGLKCRSGTCKTPCAPTGKACSVDADCCAGNACRNGACKTSVATGQACDPDTNYCADGSAACTRYFQSDPNGRFCLLPNTATCSLATDCRSKTCTGSVCVADSCQVCPTCTYTTIQAAIDAAETVISIDTGVYQEHLTIANGADVLLTTCNGADVTIKNATDNTRTIVLGSSSDTGTPNTVTIRNLTVTGKGTPVAGDPTPVSPAVFDGGIDAYMNVILEGTTAITGCNWDSYGGGIALLPQDISRPLNITLRGAAEVSNNFSERPGGGIYADSYSQRIVLEEDATITGNYAQDDGGGIYADEKIAVEMSGNAEISHNRAEGYGGGAYIYGESDLPSLTMAGNAKIVFNQSVTSQAGGVFADYNSLVATYTVVMHDNALIADNTSDVAGDYSAGGLEAYFITILMDGNAQITRNAAGATGGGGGLYFPDIDIRDNASVIDNTPDDCKSPTYRPGSKLCGVA